MKIDRLLEQMRDRLERSKPAQVTATFKGGGSTTTDYTGALDIFRQLGPFGSIAEFTTNRSEYMAAAGIMTVLCHPAPNREIENYE